MKKADSDYRAFLDILKEELIPAGGCTEPIAIAYTAAVARKTLGCRPEHMDVYASGNLIKNAKGVYIPNGGELRGVDAAAILGIAPWRTARDLYYDKLNVVKADMDENWVALEMGHLLEDLVARIFAKKTGLHILQRKVMFQHPLYPWMLADLDYLAELPDGSNAILEIKTTNYNARENWWYNGEEIVPVYYESQGRHYMSVMNLDRVYFCCLYGNNEDEVIIRHLDRDYAYESELIALEDAFWNNHVQKRQPPDYTESGDLILQSLQRWKGIDRRDLPPAAFGAPQLPQIHQYLQLQEQKNALAKQVTQLDTQMQQLKGLLVS